MQYPLEKLNALICGHSVRNEELPGQLHRLCQQAQYDICVYMSTAQNSQQAAFMLHALKVAILNMQNQMEQRPGAEQENDLPVRNEEPQPGALDQLRTFLDEQFESVVTYPLPSSLNKSTADVHEKQVLQTNLSVPQLGLFVRLLVETGILDEKNNIAALMNKIAGSLKTRKTQQISSESLRIKYYTPEKAAISILKDYVSQMMQLLRRY